MKTRRLLVGMAAWAVLAAPGLAPPAGPEEASPSALFAVLFRKGPAWDATRPPAEQLHFKDHSVNIAVLKSEGRLVVGGRFSDVGLLLIKAASREDAESLVARDASVAAGVFDAEVHPWSTFAAGCVETARQ